MRFVRSSLHYRLSAAFKASDTALRQEVGNLRQAVSNILSKKAPPEPQTTRPVTNSLPQTTNNNCPDTQTQASICMSAWNCRGLANAIPYLQTLAEKSNIIVIAEHWLWPYELSKLDSLVPGFSGIGCFDFRLHEGSSLTRGCGGVGIIWKSSLFMNNVPIDSDRIVAVQLTVSNSAKISIIGVYFPNTDNSLNVYKEYLCELENVVYALQRSGPVVIIGDFNVHIGKGYSICANCQTNPQGHLLLDMIDRTGHYAVSLSDLSRGPTHTSFSGGRNTTDKDFNNLLKLADTITSMKF